MADEGKQRKGSLAVKPIHQKGRTDLFKKIM
jgi:hypothetical protein